MKPLAIIYMTSALLSNSAIAGKLSNACVDADVKKENLALVMGVLNKNSVGYRITKINDGTYNVVARARSGLGDNINSKLISLTGLDLLAEEGIKFSRTVEGRCLGDAEDVTKL